MFKVNLAKSFAVAFILIFLPALANAKKVDSYIITNNNDTIYGTIRLSRFNLFQKTISVNSYHFDDLHDHVFFKSSTGKKFKELLPMDILEYGFMLERTKYRYISKEIKPVWGKNKRRFYRQIINGAIDLYEIQTFLNTKDENFNPYGMLVVKYFILGKDGNLIKVSKNNNESVSDFLMKYLTLNKEILAEAAKEKNYKDIKEIARVYNANVDITIEP